MILSIKGVGECSQHDVYLLTPPENVYLRGTISRHVPSLIAFDSTYSCPQIANPHPKLHRIGKCLRLLVFIPSESPYLSSLQLLSLESRFVDRPKPLKLSQIGGDEGGGGFNLEVSSVCIRSGYTRATYLATVAWSISASRLPLPPIKPQWSSF